jgi:hypothetical protein
MDGYDHRSLRVTHWVWLGRLVGKCLQPSTHQQYVVVSTRQGYDEDSSLHPGNMHLCVLLHVCVLSILILIQADYQQLLSAKHRQTACLPLTAIGSGLACVFVCGSFSSLCVHLG